MTYDTINDAQTVAGSGEGTLLANRYRVVRQLGQGGMGSVWLAKDTQLDNKPFAIKMLPSILVSNKRAYRQLKDEALVAMKLTHPNIVTLRAFEENNGNPFLVMDYIDGQTLDDYLADYGSRVEHVERIETSEAGRDARPARPPGGLPEADVLRILRPIAAALDYAHSEGVVHRDVKPANVMIRKDGHPYILDFGVAREIQETMTRVTGKLSSGTLLYMSPEQLRGHAPKPAQDVYSFAAMAYECLKGEPPFVHGQIEFQILNEQPEPLPGGTQLVASVMSGLAKNPADRPPTCSAVLVGNAFSRVEHVERVESVGASVPVLQSFSEGGPRARSDELHPSAIGRVGSPSIPPPQEQRDISHKEHKEHKEARRGVSRPPQGGVWKVLFAMVALGLAGMGACWYIKSNAHEGSPEAMVFSVPDNPKDTKGTNTSTENDKTFDETMLVDGHEACLRGDYTRATNCFNAVANNRLFSCVSRAKALVARAEIEIKQGYFDAARLTLLRALRLNRRNADVWYYLGMLSRNTYQFYEAAEEQFVMAVRLSAPDDPRTKKLRREVIPAIRASLAAAAASRPGAAKRDAGAAAKLIAEAEDLRKKRQIKAAMEKYEAALAADPFSYLAARELAYLVSLDNDKSADGVDKALLAYRAAIDLNPSVQDNYLEAAQLAYANKRWATAVSILDRAIAHDPENRKTLDLYIAALKNAGKSEQAHAWQEYRQTLR